MTRTTLAALLLLCCACCSAATLTGSVEYRVRSTLSDLGAMGNAADVLDYSWPVEIAAPTQLYHADRTVTPAAPDTVGLVGSLTNALGQSVTFTTASALYIQNLGTGTLTVTGLATATLPSLGVLSLAGDMAVASLSDRIGVSTTATGTYRLWMIGR